MSIEKKTTTEVCPYMKKCGGCQLQGVPYTQQLKEKEKQVKESDRPLLPCFSDYRNGNTIPLQK